MTQASTHVPSIHKLRLIVLKLYSKHYNGPSGIRLAEGLAQFEGALALDKSGLTSTTTV